MKKIALKLLPHTDFILSLFVYPAAWLMKKLRTTGAHKLPHCRHALMTIGVFPIQNHYYEPQFDFKTLKQPLFDDRHLPGIYLNISGQLDMIKNFSFAEELGNLPINKISESEFYLNNEAFVAGDAEYWYQLIRTIKPKRIIEIGSGNSTLMAIKAIKKNQEIDANYTCRHVCIEPFPKPYLEATGILIIKKLVEDVELSFFNELEENDILFIDSTHVITPQGDVLFEYLQLLPSLKKGVIVHIHDIFTPKNYLKTWIEDEIRFWNEQYLLEAFLSHNYDWKIIGALNYLRHNYYDKLKLVAPYLNDESEPGSFYMQKTS